MSPCRLPVIAHRTLRSHVLSVAMCSRSLNTRVGRLALLHPFHELLISASYRYQYNSLIWANVLLVGAGSFWARQDVFDLIILVLV